MAVFLPVRFMQMFVQNIGGRAAFSNDPLSIIFVYLSSFQQQFWLKFLNHNRVGDGKLKLFLLSVPMHSSLICTTQFAFILGKATSDEGDKLNCMIPILDVFWWVGWGGVGFNRQFIDF